MIQLKNPGEIITTEDFNELASLLNSMLRPMGGGDFEYAQSEMGPSLLDRKAREIWGKIGAGDGCKYAFEEVFQLDDGTYEVRGDGGATGETDEFPAVEINGITGVPEGRIFRLTQSPMRDFWSFNASGGEQGVWLRITDSTADANGDYPSVLMINNGDGTRTASATECRYRIIEDAGTTVSTGDTYWATRNGSSTIGEDEFPVYDGVGSDENPVTDCDPVEGDGYRVWKAHHPWRVGPFIAGDPP